MYKNMYNPKSKISLLLSFIATMLPKIQVENKWKQEVEKNKAKRKQENVETRLLFFKTGRI